MINLAPDEHIVYIARKHSFVFFTETTFIFILALLPLILIPGLESILIANALSGVYVGSILWYLYMLWLIVLWIAFAYVWTDYYLDVWVVTNKHMMDIDQRGLFSRKVSTSRLDLIQDVTVTIPGMLATFLDYGDIHMQTAAQSREFTLKNVAHPNKLKDIIVKEQDKVADKKIPAAPQNNTIV
ncbi:MAG: PH domain-containing protein [Parcubacteria group bacterium]|nr:PH domain-containing protein [Parcubacteria group bacterium]